MATRKEMEMEMDSVLLVNLQLLKCRYCKKTGCTQKECHKKIHKNNDQFMEKPYQANEIVENSLSVRTILALCNN